MSSPDLREWRRRLLRPPSRRLLALLLAVYAGLGVWIVRDARALPAVEWMSFYRFADFESFADLGHFLLALRTGIPPLFAALEVTEFLLLGEAFFVDVLLYRIGLLLAFALPIVAFRRTRLQCAGAFALSLFFLLAGRTIAAPNAQLYDPLLPLLLTAALLCLDTARRHGRYAGALAAAAGAALALAELSRPFVLLLLPLLVGWGLLVLRGLPRRVRVAFLLPLLLLSGGWHAKLWLAHDGQLLWSNHGGFNLYRAWQDEVVGWPEYAGPYGWIFERGGQAEDGFRGSGANYRWRWDSQSHADRSRELTHAFLRHVLREPVGSAAHAARRVSVLLAPRVQVGKGRYLGRLREPYRFLVRLGAGFSLLGLGVLLVRLVRRRELLYAVETPWLLTTWCVVFFLAVGDRGEEARFVISVLPFLAALPWPPGEPRSG